MPKSSSRYFQLPPVTHKSARTLKTSVEYCTDCVFQQTKERTWQKILLCLVGLFLHNLQMLSMFGDDCPWGLQQCSEGWHIKIKLLI